MSADDAFVIALKTGDLASVQRIVRECPERLEESLYQYSSGYGLALHTAAYYNQAEIVQFLVNQEKMDVNRHADNCAATPLHRACGQKAYAAAAMLLELGADPTQADSSGDNIVAFCQLPEVIKERDTAKRLLDPRIWEKQRQEKIVGTWTKTTPQEVVHDYEQPDNHYRLTDTFNFELRFWREVVKDLDNKSVGAPTIIFFDSIDDKLILHQAFRKLQALGGTADENSIEGRVINKPRL